MAASILRDHFDVSAVDLNESEAQLIADKIGINLAKIEDVSEFDVVILSVPISKTEEIIKKISPKLKKGSLLIDTCSVKTLPCQWMEKHVSKDVEILGAHPMFGPVTSKFNLEK